MLVMIRIILIMGEKVVKICGQMRLPNWSFPGRFGIFITKGFYHGLPPTYELSFGHAKVSRASKIYLIADGALWFVHFDIYIFLRTVRTYETMWAFAWAIEILSTFLKSWSLFAILINCWTTSDLILFVCFCKITEMTQNEIRLNRWVSSTIPGQIDILFDPFQPIEFNWKEIWADIWPRHGIT